MSQAKYPPYVNAYGSLKKLLDKIQVASVPNKFTADFLSTVLGLKSSSYRPMIPLLKRLEFLDSNNIPTQRYRDFRSNSKSKFVMAKAVQEVYSDIYQGNEYAHKLSKEELTDLIATVTGAAKEDKVINCVVGTFIELAKFASFDIADIPENVGEYETEEKDESYDERSDDNEQLNEEGVHLGISYTINLNLPPTTEIKVFDAIFKSLKRNLLDNRSIK